MILNSEMGEYFHIKIFLKGWMNLVCRNGCFGLVLTVLGGGE